MISGKSEAVYDWLAGYDGELKLSALPMEPGEKGVQVDQTEYIEQRFISGKCRRRYLITLQYVADWSGENDVINRESMRYGEEWLDWVSRQWRDGNVPDFPQATINGIEPVYNTPEIAAVYQTDALARYQFAAEINYIE